jgi:hypothetical protein
MMKIRQLLEKYLNQEIGLNYKGAAQFADGILSQLNDEYFTVFDQKSESLYHFPLRSIMEIREPTLGKRFRFLWSRKRFTVLVRVAVEKTYLET